MHRRVALTAAVTAAVKPIGTLSFACALALSASLAAGPAQAAEPASKSFAVVSLIGDELSVVTYRPSVESNIDNNKRQRLPIKDDRFDRVVAATTSAAIERTVAGAKARTLLVADPSLRGDPDETGLPEARLRKLIDAIGPKLGKDDVRYLVVISKFRGATRLKLVDGSVGSGKLTGLGFYLDDTQTIVTPETGESATGFIAPFTYLTVSLVDLGSGSVTRAESAGETQVLTFPQASAMRAWNALTAEQKIDELENLIRRTIDRVVPHVIAPA